MSIKKLLNKLDDFFDQSKKKQRKKLDKLTRIIASLQEKQAELKKEMKTEANKCKHNKKTYNLCKEFKAISKMIKKAQKQQAIISQDSIQESLKNSGKLKQ